jgi:L-alanine-DL-glutamate epimerase-like enolase superfamily enzyme
MKINKISIHHLQIPMRIRFAQSNSDAKRSDSVIVKLETEAGTVGYGESCPRTYVTGEDFVSVYLDLTSLEEELYQRSFDSFDDIYEYVCFDLPNRIGMASICGLELAMLDAWSRETQTSLIDVLGGSIRDTYDYTGVIPFGNTAKLKPIISRFKFKEVKIKVNSDLEDNLDRVQQIRDIVGPEVPIRVDVNSGWNFADGLEQTMRLIEQNISCIEQPFDPAKDSAMAYLNENYGEWIDIMADESLTTYESACRLIEEKTCNRFNLKLSKNGGILNTLRIYELAQQYGIPCQVGAHFGETSILTAAGLIFASVAGELRAMEGGLGTYLLERDVCSEPLMIDFNAQIKGERLIGKYGLGVEVEEKFIFQKVEVKGLKDISSFSLS